MRPQPPKIPRPTPAPRVAVPPRLRDPALPVQGPVIEPDGDRCLVTFLHEAPDAQAVLLFANRLTDESDLSASVMEPLGSGRWALTLRMEPDWRASYAFIVHRGDGPPPWEAGHGHVGLRALLDRGTPDPHQHDRALNRAGTAMSVVSLPAAPPQPWLGAPFRPRPTSHRVAGREVWTHQVGSGADVPLAVVLDGEVWLDHHGLPQALDAAHAAGALPPHVAVFVASGSVEDRWADVGRPDGLTDLVAHEIVPWARSRFSISPHAERTLIAGQSLGGLSALWAVARHRNVIGSAIAQSASLWRSDPGPELAASGGRVLLEVGRQEWTLLPLHRELAAQLGGMAELTEFNGGHDYACWRGSLIDRLARALTSR